jgi:hypothetical protein
MIYSRYMKHAFPDFSLHTPSSNPNKQPLSANGCCKDFAAPAVATEAYSQTARRSVLQEVLSYFA